MPSTSTDLSAKLIFPTKEIVEEFYLPIIYTACRTCYSEQVPDQIWDKAVSRQIADEKQQGLVRKVMESGHGSTIEHVNFTFAISGVTRALRPAVAALRQLQEARQLHGPGLDRERRPSRRPGRPVPTSNR